jgi:hypothetical protein
MRKKRDIRDLVSNSFKPFSHCPFITLVLQAHKLTNRRKEIPDSKKINVAS